MAVFVSDSFTDTAGTVLDSHTGETGASWTEHPSFSDGESVISDGNRLRPNVLGTNGPGYYASGVPDSAEYDVEADYRVVTVVAGSVQIAGRLSTSAQTEYLARYGDGEWQLFKAVSGSFTLLGSFSQTISAGNTYNLKLEIRDAAKKVYIDSVERISSADNAITADGRAGMTGGFNITNSTGLHVDNFVATDLSGGGSSVLVALFKKKRRQILKHQ